MRDTANTIVRRCDLLANIGEEDVEVARETPGRFVRGVAEEMA